MTGPLGLFAVVAVVLFAGVADTLRLKRVVGGTKAAPGEFPYSVSLRYYDQHICGGAIIGHRHIVTAAQCLEDIKPDMYPNFRVATGSVLSNAGTNHAIRNITIHPKYKNRQKLDAIHDIGIIELDADIVFNRNQSSIDVSDDLVPKGAFATFAGWGYQSMDAQAKVSSELMKINVTTLMPKACRYYWQGRSKIVRRNICTLSDRTAGVCLSDSGGPLVYNGTLIGLASFAVYCAQGYPDVYTSVYWYSRWIRKKTRSHIPLLK